MRFCSALDVLILTSSAIVLCYLLIFAMLIKYCFFKKIFFYVKFLVHGLEYLPNPIVAIASILFFSV